MKTLIILLLTIFIFSSCKKDKTCWNCTYGAVNGVQRPPETICNNGETPEAPTDTQGNQLNIFCTRQ